MWLSSRGLSRAQLFAVLWERFRTGWGGLWSLQMQIPWPRQRWNPLHWINLSSRVWAWVSDWSAWLWDVWVSRRTLSPSYLLLQLWWWLQDGRKRMQDMQLPLASPRWLPWNSVPYLLWAWVPARWEQLQDLQLPGSKLCDSSSQTRVTTPPVSCNWLSFELWLWVCARSPRV